MYQPQQHSGSAVVYAAQGQPVAFRVVSPVCESYRSRQSRIAGAILIITGVLSIIFNAVSIHLFEVFGFIGHGIWCGVLVSKTLLVKYCLSVANKQPRIDFLLNVIHACYKCMLSTFEPSVVCMADLLWYVAENLM